LLPKRWKQGKHEDKQLHDLIARSNLKAAENIDGIDSTYRQDPPTAPRITNLQHYKKNPEINREES
jgi:hypothetical protein